MKNLVSKLLVASSLLLQSNQDLTAQRPIRSTQQQTENWLGKAIYLGTMRAINKTSLQGGYYDETPEPSLTLNRIYDVPIYFDSNKAKMPTLESIADQLEKGIDQELQTSMTEIDENLRIKDIKSASKVKISDGKIKVEYDISINGRNLVNKTADYDSKLKGMYEIAKYLTETNEKMPGFVGVPLLWELAEKHRLSVSSFNLKTNDKNSNLSLIMISHYDQKKPRIHFGGISTSIENGYKSEPIDNTYPKTYWFIDKFPKNQPKESAPPPGNPSTREAPRPIERKSDIPPAPGDIDVFKKK